MPSLMGVVGGLLVSFVDLVGMGRGVAGFASLMAFWAIFPVLKFPAQRGISYCFPLFSFIYIQ